jgi:CTP synthase
MKTKPTQHSVKELRSIGIQPDVLVCRCHLPLQPGLKEKLSAFCDVPVESVITAQDASSIYEVPLNLEKEGLAQQTLELLNPQSPIPPSGGVGKSHPTDAIPQSKIRDSYCW